MSNVLLLVLLLVVQPLRSADNPHGPLDLECSVCHTTENWLLSPDADFSHDTDTGWQLEGAHRDLGCAFCHADQVYRGTADDCASCHTDIHEGSLGTSCAECHTPDRWDDESIQRSLHDRTRFPLAGPHRDLDCSSCHTGSGYARYAGLSGECIACHRDEYDRAAPLHRRPSFSLACLSCHHPGHWSPSRFDHEDTGYTLAGSHAATDCAACHDGGSYAGTPQDCQSCHAREFTATSSPDHDAAGFSIADCAGCHNEVSWSQGRYNQHLDFPLEGAHETASCLGCHVGNVFTGTPSSCATCHQTALTTADNPDHLAASLGGECSLCHDAQGWRPSTWNHAAETGFAMVGAHTVIDCLGCHADSQYEDTPVTCHGCHQSAYQQADEHAVLGYPLDCLLCHDQTDWRQSQYDHDTFGFSLDGAHAVITCAQCHVNDTWAGTPTDCWSCHQEAFENSSEPDHASNQFEHDCTMCHTTTAWQPSTYDHSLSAFPLTGAHLTTDCASCHDSGQYSGLAMDCWSCHQEAFESSTDPDHEAQGFPQDCMICHTTVAWEPADFDHGDSDFPLTGAHTTVDCALCHVGGTFNDTPTDCWSCHQEAYDSSTDPDHEAQGFPQDCMVCHTTVAWEPADFDHDDSDFPLTGAHTTVDCALCHVGGQYENTPTECFFCHENDYNNADDPDHLAEGFPLECAECHSTSDWDDTTFNHDQQYFLIYSGAHEGEWDACGDCHLIQGDFSEFSCTHCHEHNEADMADQHDPEDVPDYVWESAACLECHPDGESDSVPALRYHGPDLRWKSDDR